ncbi:MurR/RpiR family transcriptional regulator [Texcoconibacillus texcoconensis]|uniref:RpiR family glv operon transcriptional regulator n=1 Tax=Texcoconibacillus texcoconensis TaxID=1095777 RepID=A0A840QUM0_9BACI|nr:MurR/RpiR family transcriptional regulator [Texcoconibacillus texcoconensis]MBB5175040.1 RpiR family glv operon transcriptional regulator [Texcoconibacillus texcoconensis]
MRLEELINEHYEQLNENDMHVLKYILNHKQTCYHMGINELAETSHVSRSSIHRMTKKLGFSGYSEFRVFLKWEDQPDQPSNNHTVLLENDITTTVKNLSNIDFEEISDLLYAANRIFIYGTGTAQLMCAIEAQRMFAVTHTFITVIHDQTEFENIYPGIKETDVLIILSLSGDTPTLVPQVKKLIARGIDFISITNLKNNKLAQMSPYNIYATTTPTTAKDNTEIVSFIPFYIALETLFRRYVEYIENQ